MDVVMVLATQYPFLVGHFPVSKYRVNGQHTKPVLIYHVTVTHK